MRKRTDTLSFDYPGLIRHLSSRLIALAGNLTIRATRQSKYNVIGDAGRMEIVHINRSSVLTELLAEYAVVKSSSTVLPKPTTTLEWEVKMAGAALIWANDIVSESIDHIVMRGSPAVNQTLLRFLSVKSTGDTPQWSYPNLVRVSTPYHPDIAGDIVDFVAARCTAPPDSRGTSA